MSKYLFHKQIKNIFEFKTQELGEIKLHLKTTSFQLKVWEVLLKIPSGETSTHSKIAIEIQNPKAARAIGTVIGKNPVGLL